MKRYQAIITFEAEKDILDIYVLDNLESLILSLKESPERGHYPPELSVQGIKEFKEIIFKLYRAIYEIIESKVIVHLCVDGRRDMKTLLERRLIR